MDKEQFHHILCENSNLLSQIRDSAYKLHADVNQYYDKDQPYQIHLAAVADIVTACGWAVCDHPDNVLPLVFGAYYHDSIEDARLTYNDVKKIACNYMSVEQASCAAEIVYALTNEKGRTREERASEKYYEGIRNTPFAPFVKAADRLANASYSYKKQSRMMDIHAKEMEHFLESISSEHADTNIHFSIPPEVKMTLESLFANK